MGSLVIELQQMAESTSSDVPTLLRRAISVASKLKRDDFKEWFEHELEGYPDTAPVPPYRIVGSRIMMRNPFHGWQPVNILGDGEVVVGKTKVKVTDHFGTYPIRQSVGHVAVLVADVTGKTGNTSLQGELSPSELEWLASGNRDFLRLPTARFLDEAGVAAILDAVRNRILKWALELERKDIMGADMTFTKEEQKAAAQITINGSVGSFVQGSGATVTTTQNSPGAQVQVATGSGTIGDRIKVAVEAVRKLNPPAAEAIEKLADGVAQSAELPEGKKAEASETLAVIAEQAALPAEQRLQKVVLTPVMSSFRDNLGLSADLLQIWSTFGPVIVGWLGLILK